MLENFVDYLNTPLGLLRICASDQFVLNVYFVKKEKSGQANVITKKAKQELKEYFQGKRQKFSMPIKLVGTVWQSLVWQKLLAVPYGNIISYQDLALAVGKPQAARAVGQAVNKNPIAIMIPCHRVLGIRGDLVGYAGGLRKKEYLIKLENSK